MYIEQVRSEKNGSFVCVQVMHVGGRPRTHVTVHLLEHSKRYPIRKFTINDRYGGPQLQLANFKNSLYKIVPKSSSFKFEIFV